MGNLYEGRSINKLQNGAVSLILKISKIRKCVMYEIYTGTPYENLQTMTIW